jgi:hypothetical protein
MRNAQGSLQFPFEELLITYENHALTCEGDMWIEFTAEYDGEQAIWEFDWKYDGLSTLTCYDSTGTPIPLAGRQHKFESLVRAALDDHHSDIEDKIHESLTCI